INGAGSVSALIVRAKAEDAEEELKKKLEDFRVRVDLTAHPTQFYPGNVLAIINDLEIMIRENKLENINLLLRQLGKTPFINKEKPSPYDEAVSLCWFLENVFYNVIPEIITKLMRGLNMKLEDWTNYDLFKIGFWPGGDRDGNPYVTHEITMRVAQRLQETLLKCYHRDIRWLKRRLTFKGVDHIIARAERRIYPIAYGGYGEIYNHPDELLMDLLEARGVLINQHKGLFLNLLDSFILKVKIFGFYFASMDIRQDSRKHAEVWNAILAKLQTKNKKLKDFDTWSEEKKTETTLSLNFKPSSLKFDDPFVTEIIESINVIDQIQEQNGPEGCHRYVISNCQSAIDISRLYQLAKLILAKDDKLPLYIVPLFETIDDLKAA